MKIDMQQIISPAADVSGRRQAQSEGDGNDFFQLLRTNEQAFSGEEPTKETAKELVTDKEKVEAEPDLDSNNLEVILTDATFILSLTQMVGNQIRTEVLPDDESGSVETPVDVEPVTLTAVGDVAETEDIVGNQNQQPDIVLRGEAVELTQPVNSESKLPRMDTDNEPQQTENTKAVTMLKTAEANVWVPAEAEVVDEPVYTNHSMQQETSGEEIRLAATEQQTRVLQAEPESKMEPGKESGAEAGLMMNTALVGERQDIASQVEIVQVKTTPETLPADIGDTIAANLPKQDGTLTIELEPASLGKMTIQVVYEEGRAAVSIMSSNPKTLEILSQQAGEIARILEDKTGQQTVIYTAPPQHQTDEDQRGQEQREQNQHQEQKQNEPQYQETFAQQLRLGLV